MYIKFYIREYVLLILYMLNAPNYNFISVSSGFENKADIFKRNFLFLLE